MIITPGRESFNASYFKGIFYIQDTKHFLRYEKYLTGILSDFTGENALL